MRHRTNSFHLHALILASNGDDRGEWGERGGGRWVNGYIIGIQVAENSETFFKAND